MPGSEKTDPPKEPPTTTTSGQMEISSSNGHDFKFHPQWMFRQMHGKKGSHIVCVCVVRRPRLLPNDKDYIEFISVIPLDMTIQIRLR